MFGFVGASPRQEGPSRDRGAHGRQRSGHGLGKRPKLRSQIVHKRGWVVAGIVGHPIHSARETQSFLLAKLLRKDKVTHVDRFFRHRLFTRLITWFLAWLFATLALGSAPKVFDRFLADPLPLIALSTADHNRKWPQAFNVGKEDLHHTG